MAYVTNRDASHYEVFSSLLPLRPKYLPQHLFSNTLSLCFFLNVTDQDSHPYKKQVTIIPSLNMFPVVTKITTYATYTRSSLSKAEVARHETNNSHPSDDERLHRPTWCLIMFVDNYNVPSHEPCLGTALICR